MNIREATVDDLYWLGNAMEALVSYVQDSSDNPYIKDIEIDEQKPFRFWFEEMLSNPDNIVLVAEINDLIVGFISGMLSKPFVDTTTIGYIGQIGAVWVEPEYRKKGYCQALMDSIELWFKEQDVGFVDVHYLVGNDEAKQVWSNLGFEPYRIASKKKI